MSDKKMLISELPAEKLLKASMQLVREEHQVLTVNLLNSSPFLNPGNARNPEAMIFDLIGLKAALANCEQGLYARIEHLRELWRAVEYQCRTSGHSPERTVESIAGMKNSKIAEVAILATVRQKEVVKLRKRVTELESSQKAMQRRRCIYQGSVKRARKDAQGIWQISQADGMEVNEKGIITELNIHVDDYLAECKERRHKRRAA